MCIRDRPPCGVLPQPPAPDALRNLAASWLPDRQRTYGGCLQVGGHDAVQAFGAALARDWAGTVPVAQSAVSERAIAAVLRQAPDRAFRDLGRRLRISRRSRPHLHARMAACMTRFWAFP